jgi:hypothetical protein
MGFAKATKSLDTQPLNKQEFDKALSIIASIKLSKKERDLMLNETEEPDFEMNEKDRRNNRD